MLNSLLVLAGAVVGLAGGVFATIYAQYRQSKREIHKELRANLLAATLEASRISVWASDQGGYHDTCSLKEYYASAAQIPPAQVETGPVHKLHAIASLYFPEILKEALKLVNAGLTHQIAAKKLLTVRIDESSGNASEKDIEEQREKMHSAYNDVVDEQEKFDKSARKLMSKFLKETS